MLNGTRQVINNNTVNNNQRLTQNVYTNNPSFAYRRMPFVSTYNKLYKVVSCCVDLHLLYTIEVDANYRVTNLEAVFHGLKITLDDEVKYDGDFTVDKFTHASGNMTLYVYGDESAVNNMGYIHISLDQNMTPTSAILAGFFFADTVEIAWNDYEIRKV